MILRHEPVTLAEFERQMLRLLGGRRDRAVVIGEGQQWQWPAAEFWKRYDAGEFNK
jgi:hypothetical protein